MLRIAICDDNRADVERLETVLDELCCYSVYYDVYFEARELIEYIALHRVNYHLYIFDIEMPDMTGLELAKELRRVGPGLNLHLAHQAVDVGNLAHL